MSGSGSDRDSIRAPEARSDTGRVAVEGRGKKTRLAATLMGLLAALTLVFGWAGNAAIAAPTDGSAWEFVSPHASNGLNVYESWGWPDGEHGIYFHSPQPAEVPVASRTPEGWTSRPGVVQQDRVVVPWVADATEDLSRIVQIDDTGGLPTPGVVTEGIYVVEDGETVPVMQWPTDHGAPAKPGQYLGGSDDKRTLYIWALPGWLNGLSAPTNLYRWRDGQVEPVTIDDEDYLACPGVAPLAGVTLLGGTHFSAYYRSLLQNGVSADGETVVVRTAYCGQPARLFVLNRGGDETNITIPVEGGFDDHATFYGMSPDGSRVFYGTRAALVEDDDDNVHDLYMWTVDGGVERIARGVQQNTAQVSPDGSTVWFTSNAEGSWKLYTWRGGEVRAIVDLNANLPLGDPVSVQAAYDGTALVITGSNKFFADIEPAGMQQVYRVGIEGSVDCISCLDGVAIGSASTGTVMFQRINWPDPRISRDGSTIGFETDAALHPRDTNGRVDAYVWRDGEVDLVSSGTVGADAKVRGVSWDGRTVFFESFGAFVPGSSDPYNKLYAARVGGGLPFADALAPCVADCQGAPSPVPPPTVIGSLSFGIDGNVPQARRSVSIRVPNLKPVNGPVAALRVRVPGAGRIAVGGRAIRGARKSIARAGVYRLRIALTPRARKALRTRKRLAVRARVRYRASSGRTASKAIRVVFKQPVAKRTKTRRGAR